MITHLYKFKKLSNYINNYILSLKLATNYIYISYFIVFKTIYYYISKILC